MLQPAIRSSSQCGYRPRPTKSLNIKNKQIIQPAFAISSAKNIHFTLDNISGMELSHGRFPLNILGNFKTQLLHTFSEVDEDDI